MPATARPAGLFPSRNNTAPAAKDPYITVFFQSISPSRLCVAETLPDFSSPVKVITLAFGLIRTSIAAFLLPSN
jgi:hypothetical protein